MTVDTDFGDLPGVAADNPLLQLLLEHRRESKEWRDAHVSRMDRMEAAIQENTELTRANAEAAKLIADTMTAGRMARRFISWAGAIVLGLAGIWWGVKVALGSGGPPPGIGPTP